MHVVPPMFVNNVFWADIQELLTIDKLWSVILMAYKPARMESPTQNSIFDATVA